MKLKEIIKHKGYLDLLFNDDTLWSIPYTAVTLVVCVALDSMFCINCDFVLNISKTILLVLSTIIVLFLCCLLVYRKSGKIDATPLGWLCELPHYP